MPDFSDEARSLIMEAAHDLSTIITRVSARVSIAGNKDTWHFVMFELHVELFTIVSVKCPRNADECGEGA